jgi:ubiquitin C-terminal hydrolase
MSDNDINRIPDNQLFVDSSDEQEDEGSDSDVNEVGEIDEISENNNGPTAEEYINKFFELTNVYRDWKKRGTIKDNNITKKQKKEKDSLQQRLSEELGSAKFDDCNLESIHLFHEGNTLFIECWDKNESSGINVTQYKILLDDQVYIDKEIENLKQKLNNENYLSEVDYLRNNLLEYQAIVGKESDDYLLEMDKLSGTDLEHKYKQKESTYDGLEAEIFEKMIDIVKMKDDLEKQHTFLLNYKNIIHVKNELFGKQGTCGEGDKDDGGEEKGTGKMNVNHIERCLQHCQLKYIDFLRVLNDRYIELEGPVTNEEKKQAIMFDIIALEKQISTLYNSQKSSSGNYSEDLKYKYKLGKGALIKVQENGDIFLGIVKSHKKGNTNVSYCNKVTDTETDTHECKNVRDMIYNKDKVKEVVIPILDFIKYYKSISHLSNPIIRKGFVNEENYEYDVETSHNIEKIQLNKTEFIINKNRELVNDLGIEEQKNILFRYLHENKNDIKDNILNLCKGLSYISTEDINDFTDKTLDGIYKEIPMVYTSISLQKYVHNYILRFIKHVCDHTRIEFNMKNMDVYKTQQEKEDELQKEIQDIQKVLEKDRITTDGETTEIGSNLPESRDTYTRAPIITYGRKGLLNIGNTCFMNAAIQVFSNIKQLREFLFSLDRTDILDKARGVENTLEQANSIRMFHLITYFKNILSEIWSGRANTFVDGDVLIPFRQKISNFNMGGQHDAQEIFMQIYNDVHECLQEPLNIPLRKNILNSVMILNNGTVVSTVTGDEENEVKEEFVKSPEFNKIHMNSIAELRRIGLYSVISQLFNIIIRRVTINNKCEDVDGDLYKINYNTSKSLTLDIPHTERTYWICKECETENVFKPNDLICEACDARFEKIHDIRQPQFYKKTLEELMAFYTSQETLDEGERLRSTVCPESYYDVRETRIVSLPYVLNLSFKRTITRRGHYIKVDIPVNVPLILDMSDFIEPALFETDRIETLYSLQTIVWHGGYSKKHGGHYKVWSKQGGKWVEFNDSKVNDVIPRVVEMNGKSYIQDYQKSDYIWNIYMMTYIRQDIDTFAYKSLKVKAVEVEEDISGQFPVPEVEEDISGQFPVPEVEEDISGQFPVPEVEEDDEDKPELFPEVVEVDEADEADEDESVPEPESVINKLTLIDVPKIDGIDFVADYMVDNDLEPEIVEKEIEPDLVEVIISYKTEPTNPGLVLDNTKMFFDEEDDSYYLVDESEEPVSFYMLYDKSDINYENESDGKKVPIDNTLFYYNAEINENMIYGKIPEFDANLEGETAIRVKNIENKLYEGEFTINP